MRVRAASALELLYASGCGASSRPLAWALRPGTALLSPRMLISRCTNPVTPWLGRRGTAIAEAISRSAALPAATQFSPAVAHKRLVSKQRFVKDMPGARIHKLGLCKRAEDLPTYSLGSLHEDGAAMPGKDASNICGGAHRQCQTRRGDACPGCGSGLPAGTGAPSPAAAPLCAATASTHCKSGLLCARTFPQPSLSHSSY